MSHSKRFIIKCCCKEHAGINICPDCKIHNSTNHSGITEIHPTKDGIYEIRGTKSKKVLAIELNHTRAIGISHFLTTTKNHDSYLVTDWLSSPTK